MKFLEKLYPSLSIPVPIEDIVEIGMGIKISTSVSLKEDYNTDGFINSAFDQISIDDKVFNNYEERARFTIAHELGHKILHRKIYSENYIYTKDDYLRFQNNISEEDQKWLEIQAHIFAACTLVPTIQLKEEFEKINKNRDEGDPQFLLELPLKFKVSQMVIVKRLIKLGLVKE